MQNLSNKMYYLVAPQPFIWRGMPMDKEKNKLLTEERTKYYENKNRLDVLIEKGFYELTIAEKTELESILIHDTSTYTLQHAFNIYHNYKKIEEWETYVKEKNDRSKIDKLDKKFGINTVKILGFNYTSISDWASNSLSFENE